MSAHHWAHFLKLKGQPAICKLACQRTKQHQLLTITAPKNFIFSHKREKNALYTYSSAYFSHDCLLLLSDELMETKQIKTGHWTQSKFLYSNNAATSGETSSASLRQGIHILRARSSRLHFSTHFCHSWGYILTNVRFIKSWVSHLTLAMYSWLCSRTAHLPIFMKVLPCSFCIYK